MQRRRYGESPDRWNILRTFKLSNQTSYPYKNYLLQLAKAITTQYVSKLAFAKRTQADKASQSGIASNWTWTWRCKIYKEIDGIDSNYKGTDDKRWAQLLKA